MEAQIFFKTVEDFFILNHDSLPYGIARGDIKKSLWVLMSKDGNERHVASFLSFFKANKSLGLETCYLKFKEDLNVSSNNRISKQEFVSKHIESTLDAMQVVYNVRIDILLVWHKITSYVKLGVISAEVRDELYKEIESLTEGRLGFFADGVGDRLDKLKKELIKHYKGNQNG